MNSTSIARASKLIGINNFTLDSYYKFLYCYQYSIIDDYGVVLEPDSIFYTSEVAEREGREAINTASS